MLIITNALEFLIVGLVYFFTIALDVIFFFLVIRALAIRWPNGVIGNLDRIGSPLIESLDSDLGKWIPVISMHGRLLLIALVLTLCRVSVAVLLARLC